MLIRVHKVLIASAIALAGLFAIRALFLYARDGAGVNLGMGIGASVMVAVLALYLRRVVAKYGGADRKVP